MDMVWAHFHSNEKSTHHGAVDVRGRFGECPPPYHDYSRRE